MFGILNKIIFSSRITSLKYNEMENLSKRTQITNRKRFNKHNAHDVQNYYSYDLKLNLPTNSVQYLFKNVSNTNISEFVTLYKACIRQKRRRLFKRT